MRIHAFAAAARDLFRCASQTLAARHKARAHRRCFGHPSRDGPSHNFISEAGALHHELLAAIDDLRKAACLPPRVTVVQGAEADDSLQDALSALQGLFDSMDGYLELILKPLTPPISRDAIHAFILETRREVDELAACHTAGDVYVESLAITEPGGKAVDLEVKGSLGFAAQ